MLHNTLCNQDLHGSTLCQQCLDKSVGTIWPCKKIGECGKGSSDIPGLFLKQLPLGQCLKRCEQFIESDRWWLEKKVVYSI